MHFENYLKSLKQSGIERKIPNISDNTANFILQLLEKYNIKNMLEVGCANGYSSLYWADFLKHNNGNLHIIDVSRPMFCEALEHLQNCKLHTHVIGHIGNALDILPNFKQNIFDCIFIDAQKKLTLQFLELARHSLKPNTLLIIDDVIKFKDKMQDMYDYIEQQNIAYSIEKTDTDDGILWAIL